MKVTILGGGIGGLSLANSLQHSGIPFEIFEQAPELTEVGAGIGLSKAPLDIFEKLNLLEDIKSQGAIATRVSLPDKNLKVRRTINTGYEAVCIHRAKLIAVLHKNLPQNSIHLSKKVTGITSHPDHAIITFADGSKIDSDCVVAADGIHSVVRKNIFPEITIRHAHQTIWRGISEVQMPEQFQQSFLEIWDEGLRFLIIPIDAKRTLWLAVQPAPPGGTDHPETIKGELKELFKNFHPFVHELIDKSENFLRNDLNDLGTKKRSWFKNKVVFLGDAIHATTPNLAQGGCQAIEDGWCLSLCLKKFGIANYHQAFSEYQKLRLPKVRKIVANSWLFGKAAHSRNPLFHYTFRTFLTHSPEFLIRRQEKFLNDLSYLEKL